MDYYRIDQGAGLAMETGPFTGGKDIPPDGRGGRYTGVTCADAFTPVFFAAIVRAAITSRDDRHHAESERKY